MLEYLENIDVKENPAETGFTYAGAACLPSPTAPSRGFQGTDRERQCFRRGIHWTVLPSGESAAVRCIYQGSDEVQTSSSGHAVTIQLDSEIDISRGCVLVENTQVSVGTMFEASILWMDDTKLVEGKNYLLIDRDAACAGDDHEYQI